MYIYICIYICPLQVYPVRCDDITSVAASDEDECPDDDENIAQTSVDTLITTTRWSVGVRGHHNGPPVKWQKACLEFAIRF